jgi:hypothetical protein
LIQGGCWNAKQALAERVLVIVGIAQQRLQSRQALAVDEPCDLISGVETNRSLAMSGGSAVLRELINEHVTPDQERAWYAWWALHPEDTAENKAFTKAQSLLFAELQHVMQAGEDPSSPEAQKLVERHNGLLRTHGVRERAVRLLAWNSSVTRKWFGIGAKARDRASRTSSAPHAEFFMSALKQSPLGTGVGGDSQ